MSNIFLLILLVSVAACSGGGGGSSSGTPGATPVVTYNAVYSYPPVTLNPGDGTVSVNADGVTSCVSSTGQQVDISLCPGIDEAPVLEVKSPAGQVQVPVTGAVGGYVLVDVTEGQNFSQIPAPDLENLIIPALTCESPRVKVGAECRMPGYSYTLSSYPAPTKTTPCSGSETLTRTITGCQNSITLDPVDMSNCSSEPAPVLSLTHNSPAGNVVETNNGNTETYSCASGSTVKVLTDITCGNANQHKDGLTCVNDTFTALAFSFPANTMQPGDGTITVTATAITQCRNDHTSQIVSNALCTMPDPAPTQTQKSPAGNKSVVNAGNTEVYTYAEGSSSGTLTDITCGNVNQHKDGLTCVNDTFTALSFNYPANTMQPGDGQLTVSAISISQCRNDHTSQIVSNALCTMPDPAPTQVQLSPAGNKTVVNAGNTEVYTYAEGSNSGTLTDITCGNANQHKVGLTCVNDTFTALAFSFPANNLQIGDGTQTVNATGITQCRNDHTSQIVSNALCTMPDPVPTEVQVSPPGTKQIVSGGNTETYAYLAGETTGNLIDIICGNANQHKVGLTCVNDTFTALSFNYPANNMQPGDGTRTVSATSVSLCQNDYTSSLVSAILCVLPDPVPTIVQSSPEGDKQIVNGLNTETYHYLAGQTTGTLTDIICGDPDQYKSGLTCLQDTFIPSSFTYPANTLQPGQGSIVVSATGFTVCTKNSNGQSVSLAKCTMPGTIPTTTQLSPAGQIHVTYSRAVGGEVLIPVSQGYDYYSLSQAVKDALFANYLVCESNYTKNGMVCENGIEVMVAMGYSHICGLKSNGNVYCTGDNSYRQLGYPTGDTYSLVPAQVNLGSQAKAIYAIGNRTFFLLSDGTVKGVGENGWGQLGVGYRSDVLSPTQSNFGSTVKSLHLSIDNTCAILTNDTVKCSGYNSFGQLGDGTTAIRSTPVAANFGSTVKSLAVSKDHMCAVLANDTVKCVGRNDFGQLGDGTTTNRSTPVTANFGGTVRNVYVGEEHTCAHLYNDTVKCMGNNSAGQLGDGTNTNRSTPVAPNYGSAVIDLTLGTYHTCALLVGGTVKCHGANASGQLGDGTTTNRATPVSISYPNTLSKIFAGPFNTCGITGSNTVQCTGSNGVGNMGTGTVNDSYVPILTLWGSSAKSLSFNYDNMCVVYYDNTIKCAGANYTGQLGDNSINDSSTPLIFPF